MVDDPELVSGAVSRALAAVEARRQRFTRETGVCLGCDGEWRRCGPTLWDQGCKCCPDCSHVAEPPVRV